MRLLVRLLILFAAVVGAWLLSSMLHSTRANAEVAITLPNTAVSLPVPVDVNLDLAADVTPIVTNTAPAAGGSSGSVQVQLPVQVDGSVQVSLPIAAAPVQIDLPVQIDPSIAASLPVELPIQVSAPITISAPITVTGSPAQSLPILGSDPLAPLGSTVSVLGSTFDPALDSALISTDLGGLSELTGNGPIAGAGPVPAPTSPSAPAYPIPAPVPANLPVPAAPGPSGPTGNGSAGSSLLAVAPTDVQAHQSQSLRNPIADRDAVLRIVADDPSFSPD